MDEEEKAKMQVLQTEVEVIDDKLESIGMQINELLARQEKLSNEKEKILKKIDALKDQTAQQEKEINWNSNSFPWSIKLKEIMRETYHVMNFRPLQKETINVALSKKDCILIMPTGGGKSLTFQLPALTLLGFTLVISPLISLMEDQLIALHKLNVKAMMLSASTGTAHNSEVLSKMIAKSTDLKILYVTPERLAKSKRFMSKLDKAYAMGNISMIAIDEVHCASTWGNDFRPDYKTLCILKRQYPKVPLLGLTATASEKVLDDIKDILGLERCIVFRASFNRPNLYYEVYKTSLDQKMLTADIAKRIKLQFKGMSGIVYCFSRKDSEEVASGLVNHGITAHCYHGDLPAAMKTNAHEGWINGHIQVVVATVAFGMGIDKPNVRFVIHFSISKSIENYYQESGRAGRDDEKSWCILYFRFQDIWRQAAMVFTEKTGLQNLHDMLSYAVNREKCRRTLLGNFFSEQWQSNDCKKMCDNCQRDQDALKQRPLNTEARELVDILEAASYREERLTPIKLIDNWLGKCKVKDRPKDICQLPRDECEDIVTKLLVYQVLREDFHFTPYNTITYIVPGPRWPHLKHGKITVNIDLLSKKSRTKSEKKKSEPTEPVMTNGNSLTVFKEERKANKEMIVCIELNSDDNDECKEKTVKTKKKKYKFHKNGQKKSDEIEINSDLIDSNSESTSQFKKTSNGSKRKYQFDDGD